MSTAEECGSYAGYQQHYKKTRLVTCRPCLRAYATYARNRRHARKCAPGLGWPLVARRG
jgi:hypothetical protein